MTHVLAARERSINFAVENKFIDVGISLLTLRAPLKALLERIYV